MNTQDKMIQKEMEFDFKVSALSEVHSNCVISADRHSIKLRGHKDISIVYTDIENFTKEPLLEALDLGVAKTVSIKKGRIDFDLKKEYTDVINLNISLCKISTGNLLKHFPNTAQLHILGISNDYRIESDVLTHLYIIATDMLSSIHIDAPNLTYLIIEGSLEHITFENKPDKIRKLDIVSEYYQGDYLSKFRKVEKIDISLRDF